jgi:hypothetical protein
MERRIYKRIPVGLDANISVDDTSYSVYIGNMSAHGVYLMTVQDEKDVTSQEKDEFQLRLKMCTGETLILQCRKKWSYTISPRSLMSRMGLEIIDPPLQFKEFLFLLQKSTFLPARNEVILQ